MSLSHLLFRVLANLLWALSPEYAHTALRENGANQQIMLTTAVFSYGR